MEDYEIFCIFINSVCKVYKYDYDLIKIGANERAITHRLAFYIEEELKNKELDVDCEYNRDGYDPKKNNDEKCIIPDVIIHKRVSEINYLVIEAKKEQRKEEYMYAKDKLIELTDKNGKYKYPLGIFIDFKKDMIDTLKSIEYYKEGVKKDLSVFDIQ